MEGEGLSGPACRSAVSHQGALQSDFKCVPPAAVSPLQASAVPSPAPRIGRGWLPWWPGPQVHFSLAADTGPSSPPPAPTLSYLVSKLGVSRVVLAVCPTPSSVLSLSPITAACTEGWGCWLAHKPTVLSLDIDLTWGAFKNPNAKAMPRMHQISTQESVCF